MRAIVTVVGPDRVGIMAEVCTLLAQKGCNIEDIQQTVMREFFTMNMLVNTDQLHDKGEQMHLSIRIQREDIFTAMHQI